MACQDRLALGMECVAWRIVDDIQITHLSRNIPVCHSERVIVFIGRNSDFYKASLAVGRTETVFTIWHAIRNLIDGSSLRAAAPRRERRKKWKRIRNNFPHVKFDMITKKEKKRIHTVTSICVVIHKEYFFMYSCRMPLDSDTGLDLYYFSFVFFRLIITFIRLSFWFIST